MSIEQKERLKREGDLDESGRERCPHTLRARRMSNILEKVSSSLFGRVARVRQENGGQIGRISGSGFEVDRRGGSPGISHIAGDKYRARESRPKIPATSCGKGRTGSWKSFHCGRTLQSNGLFLPLSDSLSSPACILHAGLPKLGYCPTKTRCPCTVTETNTDCRRRVKRNRRLHRRSRPSVSRFPGV